jgi:flagellar basal body-associated protein FliL
MKVTLNKILGGICVLIILVIIIGTGIALKPKKQQEQATFRPAQPVPTPEEQIQQAQKEQLTQQEDKSTQKQEESSKDFNSYLNLGELRITTKIDEENQTTALIILEPWFSYTSTDPAFQEEVTTKKANFKTIVLDFFANRTANQVKAMGEDLLKNQLLELANKELVLGKFSAVFFDDYIFFE